MMTCVVGLSQLDPGSFGRIGVRALAYYFTTTSCAVVIGICCVLAIHPGDPSIKGKLGAGEEDHRVLTIDAFLDLIRYLLGTRHSCRTVLKFHSGTCMAHVDQAYHVTFTCVRTNMVLHRW